MSATLIATTEGEFLLVEAALPGRSPEPIGVLLHERDGGRLELRLRRDWDQWMDEDDEEVFTHLESDFVARISSLGPEEFLRQGEDSFSHAIWFSERRAVMVDRFERTLDRLYRQHVNAKVQKFHTHLPVYCCRVAAGGFGEQMAVEAEGWRETPAGMRLTEDMFVAQVVGRSMEPEIADGSWCVFRAGVTGSRTGRRVLVEDVSQSEQGGERYTVKRYTSKKSKPSEYGEWRHDEIMLESLNPECSFITLTEDPPCRVIAEFICVLD